MREGNLSKATSVNYNRLKLRSLDKNFLEVIFGDVFRFIVNRMTNIFPSADYYLKFHQITVEAVYSFETQAPLWDQPRE